MPATSWGSGPCRPPVARVVVGLPSWKLGSGDTVLLLLFTIKPSALGLLARGLPPPRKVSVPSGQVHMG